MTNDGNYRSMWTLLLVIVWTVIGGNGQRTVKIAILSEAEGSVLNKALVEKYYKAAETKLLGKVTNTVQVVELKMNSSESKVDFAKRASTFLSTEKPCAMVGPSSDVVDFLFSRKVPYFLSTNGFVDYLNKDSKKLGTCLRPNTTPRGAITVLPALDYIVFPLLNYIGFWSKVEGVSVGVIAEDPDDISNFFNSDSMSMGRRPRLSPLILHMTLNLDLLRKRLGSYRSQGYKEYIVHSYNLDYIKGIFQLARSLDMMVPSYTWYLTYPNINALNRDQEGSTLIDNDSRVLGFDIVGSFKPFGLADPPIPTTVAHATLLDSMITVAKAVSSSTKSGAVVQAVEIKQFVQAEITRTLDGVTGSLVGTNNKDLKNTMLCRKTAKVAVHAFRNGTFSKLTEYELKNSSFISEGDKLPAKEGFDFKVLPNTDSKTSSIHFNTQPVKIIARLDAPLIMVNASSPIGYSGVLIDYLNEYGKRMNFTYTIDPVADGQIGEFSYQGWTGLVGQILDEKATFVIGSFHLTEPRSKVMDSSALVRLGYLSILAKRPTIQTSPWQFVQPFTWGLWLTVVGIYVFVSIMLYLVTMLDKRHSSFPLPESFYYLAGLLLAGATDAHPTSTPSRIVIGVFVFFSIVVFQSYTANMTAFLTMRRAGDVVENLEVLSKQSSYDYGVVKSSEALNIISNAQEEPLKRIWAYISRNEKTRILKNYEDAIKRVKEEKFVLISETVISEYHQSKDCELMSIEQQDTIPIRYSIGLPKGAPIKKALDATIEKVNEEDVGEKIRRKWYANPDCDQELQSSSSKIKTSPLTWSEMMGVFITLAIGAGVALLVAGVGFMYTRSKQQNKSGGPHPEKPGPN